MIILFGFVLIAVGLGLHKKIYAAWRNFWDEIGGVTDEQKAKRAELAKKWEAEEREFRRTHGGKRY